MAVLFLPAPARPTYIPRGPADNLAKIIDFLNAKRELLSGVRSSINFPICKLVAVNRELDLPISGADFQWAGLLITIRRRSVVPDGHGLFTK